MIDIRTNVNLKEYNTFGIEVLCDRLVEYETCDELAAVLLDSPEIKSGRWAVLGGGSNVLFRGDFHGTLLRPRGGTVSVTGRREGKVTVRADAGVEWNEFTRWCAERNLWGVENLAGIPGTVGAAPVQNIGAYGAEVAGSIVSVEALDVGSLGRITLHAEHCAFGYRDSVFKRSLRGRAVITAVNFALAEKGNPKLDYGNLSELLAERENITPLEVCAAVIHLRNSKLPDPRTVGSAGSFFKNPVVDAATAKSLSDRWPDMPAFRAASGGVKLSAGWLIEKAGWKGRREGDAGVHDRQALVLVNYGRACGADILALAGRIQDDVNRLFGVRIKTEVNIF